MRITSKYYSRDDFYGNSREIFLIILVDSSNLTFYNARTHTYNILNPSNNQIDSSTASRDVEFPQPDWNENYGHSNFFRGKISQKVVSCYRDFGSSLYNNNNNYYAKKKIIIE